MNFLKLIKENSVLIVIILIATFLRFYHLDFQSIWLDEIHTLIETNPKLSFNEFKELILFREGMGHFYFFIIRTLNDIFTYSTYTARMFSAVTGVLSVFYIYKLGKIIFNKNTGLIAAALLTVNWFAIFYSQEARPYILLMFCVIVSYYRLIIFIKKPSVKNAIFYGIITGLVFNSHTIGLLNIFSQYLLLFFVFLISSKKEKFIFFKNGIITFLVALLFSIPMYQMLMKMSQYKSGWLQLPGSDGFSQIFNEFLGNTELLYFIFNVLIIFYLIKVFNQKEIKLDYENVVNNKLIFSSLLLISWFFFPILISIIKSYTSEPMILHRYFITLVPALVITIAIGIDLIKNAISKTLIIVVIIAFSLTDLFFIKDYYNKTTKTEFREVTNQIIKRNKNNDKIVSTYGWLMSYFFNQYSTNQLTIESNFHNYIAILKNKSEPLESFWYMDGNSLPYNLSIEDEQFLNEQFILKESFEKYDTWAHHYISKNPPKKDSFSKINIKNFTPGNFDSNGNLMIFESSVLKSPVIELEKGFYNLTINANSLPSNPINGENAHLIIKINGEVIDSFYLNENIENKKKTIEFQNKKFKKARVLIQFDNDVSVNDLDRNVVIYSLQLERK